MLANSDVIDAFFSSTALAGAGGSGVLSVNLNLG